MAKQIEFEKSSKSAAGESAREARTVFISCFTGLISRNILSTDAFRILVNRPRTRLVIVAPKNREIILREEFGGANVFVEGVEIQPLKRLDRFFWVLATNFLDTQTRRVQRLAKLERDKNYLDYFFSRLAAVAGRWRTTRQVLRFLTAMFASSYNLESIFEKYHPDLVFTTDVFTPLDVRLLAVASRRNIRTVGMVRSWDNVTSKTLLTIIPQFMVVNTARVKDEIVRFGDVLPSSVFITGIPHYDRYNGKERIPRDVFFKKLGLNPDKKLILFTPPGDNYLKHDPITPVVLKAVAETGVQVLVRVPLVGKVDFGGYVPPPTVVLDEPGNSPDFTEAHLTRAADQHLADSIFHSNLVITWASTMIIDALVFSKPVILVGFDAAPRPYGQSIQQYYDYSHQRDIINRGGVRLAKNSEELTALVKKYLADPELDSASRRKTADEFCGKLDGRAGERLANFLSALI